MYKRKHEVNEHQFHCDLIIIICNLKVIKPYLQSVNWCYSELYFVHKTETLQLIKGSTGNE